MTTGPEATLTPEGPLAIWQKGQESVTSTRRRWPSRAPFQDITSWSLMPTASETPEQNAVQKHSTPPLSTPKDPIETGTGPGQVGSNVASNNQERKEIAAWKPALASLFLVVLLVCLGTLFWRYHGKRLRGRMSRFFADRSPQIGSPKAHVETIEISAHHPESAVSGVSPLSRPSLSPVHSQGNAERATPSPPILDRRPGRFFNGITDNMSTSTASPLVQTPVRGLSTRSRAQSSVENGRTPPETPPPAYNPVDGSYPPSYQASGWSSRKSSVRTTENHCEEAENPFDDAYQLEETKKA